MKHLTRLLLWLRFHLFQRHRFNRLVLEHVAGRPLLVLPQVFNPTLFLTSEFMVQALNEQLIPAGTSLLDMGTGSGIGAIFAAQWAGRVTAVDINPAAARCARINVLLNQLEDKITVYEGDLFTPLAGQRFDVILFNPPYYRGTPTSPLDHAFRATDVVERFAAAATDYLAPAGHILLLLANTGDETAFLQTFRHHGYTPNPLAHRHLPGEQITLWQLKHNP